MSELAGSSGQRKAPLLPSALAQLCRSLPPTIRGLRDQALLLAGWAAAQRRSELVTLHLADVLLTSSGLRLPIRQSKTDTAGTGQEVVILRRSQPTCAVAALEAWLARRGDAPGPLFVPVPRGGHLVYGRLSDKAEVRALKAAIRDARDYAAHSLRAGLVTTAHLQGASLHQIAAHTRHRSLESLRD